MQDNQIYYDELTKIHNEKYFNENYQDYLKNNPKSYYIMIDFKKFKHFNDTYGHDVGDNYLKVFAKILDEYFEDSLVSRLHGDEYAVLTKFNKEEIIKIFDLCSKRISQLVIESEESLEKNINCTEIVPVKESVSILEMIPEKFTFNAGIVEASNDYRISRLKADTMMYYAKNNNNNYQFFEDALWRERINQKDFVDNVANDINTDKLTYFQREIVDHNGNKIIEVSTRDSQGNSIFSDSNYNVLRNNFQLQKVDLYNLRYILVNLANNIDSKIIMNLDYKSLLSKMDLLPYIKSMITKYKLESSKIILSINVSDVDSNLYQSIIDIMKQLKEGGFGICIDKYSDKIPDIFFNEISIDYIKIDNKYWKDIMHKNKSALLLAAKIKLFKEIGNVNTILTCVENEYEYDFIIKLTNNNPNILLSGNYISGEREIKLK